MSRDTIRAALRNITACSGPNCVSSAGCTSSPPPLAGRKCAPDGETASWTIETKAGDWQTRTSYDFLRWEDLIQRDLAAPIWRTVFHAMWIYWRLVFGGTIARFWRAHLAVRDLHQLPAFPAVDRGAGRPGHRICLRKRPGSAAVFPACSALPPRPPLFVAVLGTALKYTENLTYLLYLLSRHDLDLGILAPPAAGMGRAHRPLRAISRRRSPRSSDAEEIVVVGHSSGSFLGAEIVARALKLDPALGRTARASCC